MINADAKLKALLVGDKGHTATTLVRPSVLMFELTRSSTGT